MKSKALVVFYSRTGNTKKIANEIAKNLKADICEIESDKYKSFFGFFKAGKDAILKKKTRIKVDKNPSDYNLIIIGTPNWGAKMASPVRTFIDGKKFKKSAYFCTQGGSWGEKVLDELDKICGNSIAKLIINEA